MPTSIQQALQSAQELLSDSDSPRLDAELLLAHCLEQTREYLFTYPTTELDGDNLLRFQQLVERRKAGEPIAYITGKRDFWDVELVVTSDVLVPRPETELLVESALEAFGKNDRIRVADLGTGSGAIAIALAKHRSNWSVLAVDLSDAALAVARNNAERLQLSNIEFKQSSWCDGLEVAAYDLILANPPYVAPGDAHLEQGDLRFEPDLALESAQEGFADLFTIAAEARQCLKVGGSLMMEHGFDQQERLGQELELLGYTEVIGKSDLAGQPRMMHATWTGI